MLEPTQRFTSRVDNYVRYRPSYPPAVLELLEEHCDLSPASAIADIGSGTGKLTELFLRNGNLVYAVEPNDAMRAAAEGLLQGYPNFRSVAGTAEATTLASSRVNVVTAGQAFHWFEPIGTRREFRRILKPGGWVVLVWNERQTQGNSFMEAYEALLKRYVEDYERLEHKHVSSDGGRMATFFGNGDFSEDTFTNAQAFDLEGLKGRLLSSSYAPEEGDPRHASMLADLRALFQKHEEGQHVTFMYDTRVFFGRLG
jgi:SAM-dependent methyltransferase